MNQNQRTTINLDKMPTVKCKCGNETFTTVQFLKRVPGLMVGQAQDQIMPLPAFECNRCKKLLDIGKLLKNEPEKEQSKGNIFSVIRSKFQ